ncbi:hypothetical protein ACJRO7_034430 [Eucalyptus globulus]|uniref:Uncharacterized protein n=1 Tax=Eucalyptus globulus TaxID=34317 RepID=A0ABD3J6I0_EUCGL
MSRRWRARTSSGAYFVKAFYIVTSALGIYMLNLLIGFLSPQVDPELQELAEGGGPSLPTRGSDEFKPFARRLPEFKCCTPFYWVMLLTLTMRRQIMLIVKYKYVPISFGKWHYDGKRASSTESASLPRD